MIINKHICNYRPVILILDSGVGGLFIYNQIKRVLSFAKYIYFFDNEYFPYGKRSDFLIVKRLINILKTIQKFLKFDVVIIACNTASVVACSELKKIFSFPIIGIVPDVKLAVMLSRNKIIGLLSTNVTINSMYMRNLIKKFSGMNLILQLDISNLIEIVENKLYGKCVSLTLVRKIMRPWLELDKIPDTIILGCTHLLFLKNEFKKIFHKNIFFVCSRNNILQCILKVINISVFNIYKLSKFNFIKNRVYCSTMSSKTLMLMPSLIKYGFSSLEKIRITNF
ncbi:Glutamate racemase [Candidatus Westeberhardia cardiocondylae]|uniref:Glutamate racemase n=1 Tax=Candidatus Westeberhardia cardiocondylae TaxID=1594731 RepID=A0A0H5BWN3_9ENTR|nr:glutamate racemase [Candidatus Westeberhardia cardiocondylae]MCR3756143.1 glutamate racemase [Candidatus Westeberhardia cardiocondylae]CEN32019.1 Glutamate racemase [Candidatus Westeberhardia cardiocondylae]